MPPSAPKSSPKFEVALPAWQRYGAAVLLVALALGCRLALQPALGSNYPFMAFFLATLITARYFGLDAAVLCFVLGTAAATYFFVIPYHTAGFMGMSTNNAVALVLYVLIGVVTLWVTDRFRVALRKVEQNERFRRQSEERLSTILRSIEEAVVATDASGAVTFMNPVAERLTGWMEEAARGQRADAVLALVDTENVGPHPVLQLLAHAPSTNRARRYGLRSQNGATWRVELSVSPKQGAGGELTGAVAVFRDIGQVERIEFSRRFLADAGAILSSTLHYQETLQKVVDLTIPSVADWCTLDLVNEDGSLRRLAAMNGNPEQLQRLRELVTRFPEMRDHPDHPIQRVMLTRQTYWLRDIDPEDVRLFAASDDYRAAAEALRAGSFICVPMHSSDRLVGILSLSRGETSPRYEEEDVALAEELAGRAAAAVERARLYQQVQDAQWRLAFLVEASAVLASSLDVEQTLSNVARLTVPQLADWCSVEVLESDGSLRRLALAHEDPEKVAWANSQPRRAPDMDAAYGLGHVLRNGTSELYSDIPDHLLAERARDDAELAMLRQAGLRSVIIVPIQAQGAVLGAISLITAESGRRYTDVDLRYAEDLGQRAAVAIENARLYQSVQESDRRKDEFLAMLAHELRNPLAPIATALYLTRDRAAADPKLKRPLGVIERQVRQLTRLTDDLLDVSRITRGKMQLRLAPLDLSELVRETVDDHLQTFELAGLSLTAQAPDQPVWVEGDRARLSQAIGNLLGNAVKFTARGGSAVVRLHVQGQRALVEVEDSGVGISPDLLPHVFDTFTQADTSLDRSRGGLGLGLALVKGLMVLHQGEARAHSEGLGHGSRFTLDLPLASAAEAAEAPAAPSRTATDPAERPRLKVLIVEDNVDGAATLQELLWHDGYEAEVATNGLDGVAAARRLLPDVVFCDIGLPGLDGYGVARSIREIPELRNALLVAISGYAQDSDRRRSAEAGFNEHLAKPADPEVLRALLARREAALVTSG